MREKRKHLKKDSKKNSLKFIYISLIILFILGLAYLSYTWYSDYKNKKNNSEILNTIKIDETQITETKSERILQLEELQKENSEIIAWLEIPDTNINYPILQAKDNDFYLDHDYKKDYSINGSLFLDKDFDIINGSSNYLIYGHRNKQGLMFEDLLKYADEDFYNSHKKIKFTTNEEDCMYEVVSVFYSRVYYKKEENVFRYYYFVNANSENEYNDFVYNAKKVSLYDTGVNPQYGEQLLTLSTCEYSQEDGRFVVVLKKEGIK